MRPSVPKARPVITNGTNPMAIDTKMERPEISGTPREHRLKANWTATAAESSSLFGHRLPIVWEEEEEEIVEIRRPPRPAEPPPPPRMAANHRHYRRLWFYLLTTVLGGLICDHRPRWVWPHLERWFKYATPNPYHLFLVKSHWLPVNVTLHVGLTAASGAVVAPRLHHRKPSTHNNNLLQRLVRIKLVRFTAFYLCYDWTQRAFDWFLEFTEQARNGTACPLIRPAGIDISGHVFVLILSNLFLINETQLIEQFLYHRKTFRPSVPVPKSNRIAATAAATDDDDEVELPRRAPPSVEDHSPPAIIWAPKLTRPPPPPCLLPPETPILVARMPHWHWWAVAGVHATVRIVSVAWDVFLLQTQFFYHTTGEKFVALLIAVACVNFISKLPIIIGCRSKSSSSSNS